MKDRRGASITAPTWPRAGEHVVDVELPAIHAAAADWLLIGR